LWTTNKESSRNAERLQHLPLSSALSELLDLPLQLVNFGKQIQHDANASPIHPEILVEAEDAANL
jgi:hypothetical protein